MGDAEQDKDRGSHKILLIRHGETVDNLAGLYAGSKDSILTNHGFQQISRLGSYFAERKVRFSHVFSSNLSRASKTADAICKAQAPDLESTQLSELREQDFGYLEGKPTSSRVSASRGEAQKKTGNKANDELHPPQDIESKEALAERVEHFLNNILIPLLDGAGHDRLTVAIVSHGMLLSALWRCMLRSQAPGTVVLKSDVVSDTTPIALEYIGGWSNTGYLDIDLSPFQPSNDRTADQHTHVSEESKSLNRPQFSITVCAINKRDHLSGLKRTRGGVGSSRYDEGQKSIHSFFKKQKIA